MRTIRRVHKIRLNLAPEQEPYFRQAAGNARFAWNWAVAFMREAWKAQTNLPLVGDLKTEFNRIKREQFPFVMDTTKCATEQVFADLRQALANFFNDLNKRKNGKGRKDGKRVGFPKFKSRKRGYGSFYYDLTLSDRAWVCPACGATLDRDLNAAQNIRDEGIRLVSA